MGGKGKGVGGRGCAKQGGWQGGAVRTVPWRQVRGRCARGPGGALQPHGERPSVYSSFEPSLATLWVGGTCFVAGVLTRCDFI